MNDWNSRRTANNEGILIAEEGSIKKSQHDFLLELIHYKFGDIPVKVSSIIKQMNYEQIFALRKGIFEAKTLQELV
jgi:hypothetical protein